VTSKVKALVQKEETSMIRRNTRSMTSCSNMTEVPTLVNLSKKDLVQVNHNAFPLSLNEDSLIEELMRKIWEQRTSKTSFLHISKWPEYINFQQRFKDWLLQIETEVKKMCNDVHNFNDPPYEVDVINSRLGYRHKDSIDWDQTFGYRTAFAYLC